MKKKNKRPIEIEIMSYGVYTKWDRDAKALPKFQSCTLEILAVEGIEFGMIVQIAKARGRYLHFIIDHPPFKDSKGKIEPPFEGTFRVKHNPFEFFLGDTIWNPVDDKKGEWRLSILDGEKVLVSIVFEVI